MKYESIKECHVLSEAPCTISERVQSPFRYVTEKKSGQPDADGEGHTRNYILGMIVWHASPCFAE